MKDLVKLIGKCVLVSLPIWCLSLYLRHEQMQYMIPEEACLKWNESITSSMQDKYYKAIVIGDSTGNAAFMPEAVSDSMINLSILGTGPIEGYYVLKEYLENNEAPEACFVCFY